MICMTLIEFLKEAQAVYAAAGLIGRVRVTVEANQLNDAATEYGYRITGHTQASTMVKSWSDRFPYDCNNPALALERFAIACENATRPAAEPVAIGDIEAPNEESEVVE